MKIPLRLEFEYFGAGPGAGGISALEIKLARTRLAIWEFADITDAGGIRERVASLDARCEWRSIIASIVKSNACAFYTDGDTSSEYAWPDKMHIHGEDSFASDLIACAWSGPPISEIALGLCAASDQQLSDLREHVGSLRSRRFIERVLKLMELVSETGEPLSTFVRRAASTVIDLNDIQRDAKALIRVIDAEHTAARLRKEWSVSPWISDIDRITQNWREANPATSMNTQIGVSARSGELRRFVEQYVIDNRELPTGVHHLTCRAFSSPLEFAVNFDDLQK